MELKRNYHLSELRDNLGEMSIYNLFAFTKLMHHKSISVPYASKDRSFTSSCKENYYILEAVLQTRAI